MKQLTSSMAFVVNAVKNGTDGRDAAYDVISYALSAQATTASPTTAPVLADGSSWQSLPPLRTFGTFVWQRIQHYNESGVLVSTSYVRLTGDKGDTGSSAQKGRWYDYAGIWGTDVQSVTNTPNIGYYVRCNNNFYMNIAADGVANTTTPGTDNTVWEQMSDDRNYYIGKAYFGDYCEFGSGIINGDWQISRVATIGSPSAVYTDFDPAHPNESTGSNFIPQYAIDMRNGIVYMNSAELRGKITSESGSIAGWSIDNSAIFKNIELLGENKGIVKIANSEEVLIRSTLMDQTAYLPAVVLSLNGLFDVTGKVQLSPAGLRTILPSGVISNEIGVDGAGFLAKGAVSWDKNGNVTLGSKFSSAMASILGSGYGTQIAAGIINIFSPSGGGMSDGGITISGQTGANNQFILLRDASDEDGDYNYMKLTPYLLEFMHDEFVLTRLSSGQLILGSTTTGDQRIEIKSDGVNVPFIKFTNGQDENRIYAADNAQAGDYGDLCLYGLDYVYLENDVVVGDHNGSVHYDVTASSFIQSSDERLKTKIDDITLTAEDIARAPAIRFVFKGDKDHKVRVGSIAQYWQAVLPEVVNEDANGMLGLDYASLAAVNTISLAKEVVALKQENAELKAKLQTIMDKLGI